MMTLPEAVTTIGSRNVLRIIRHPYGLWLCETYARDPGDAKIADAYRALASALITGAIDIAWHRELRIVRARLRRGERPTTRVRRTLLADTIRAIRARVRIAERAALNPPCDFCGLPSGVHFRTVSDDRGTVCVVGALPRKAVSHAG